MENEATKKNQEEIEIDAGSIIETVALLELARQTCSHWEDEDASVPNTNTFAGLRVIIERASADLDGVLCFYRKNGGLD